MPRNGGGVYSLPGTYEAISGETILAAQHNDPLEDLEQDANAARPVGAGGTGGQTAIAGNDGLNTTANNIASATTTSLALATGVVVNITGTTTITGLGTVSSGAIRVLIFAGILTFTHNATSLILPGGANIATAAGDIAVMRSKGSGNWVCTGYLRAAGLPLTGVGAQTITSSAAGTLLTLESTEAGATNGPDIELYRNSASPAANDFLGQLHFYGKDSAGNKQDYAQVAAQILDPASATEDALLYLATIVAGTLAVRFNVGAGIYAQGLADQGASTFHGLGFFNNGVALPTGVASQADQETGTSTVLAVTPGRQQFHPSAAKFWANVNQSGATPTLANSFNVSSITDVATGQMRVNINVDFTDAGWSPMVSLFSTTDRIANIEAKAAGTVTVRSSDIAGTDADPDSGWEVYGFGDQP